MNDPIVTEVRCIREQRAAKFGFDLKRIMADARRRERASDRKVVTLTPRRLEVSPKP
jgi:hypothetical protein